MNAVTRTKMTCIAVIIFFATLPFSFEEMQAIESSLGILTEKFYFNSTQIIKASSTTSIIGCNLECLHDENCTATNFYSANDDEGSGFCELLSLKLASIDDIPLIFQENATFTELKKSKKEQVKKKEPVQPSCGVGYQQHSESGSCFSLSTYVKTWQKANESCRNGNGMLAKIDKESQLEYVKQITGQNYLFVGLKQSTDGVVSWADGSSFDSSANSSVTLSRENCGITDHCCGYLVLDVYRKYQLALGKLCANALLYLCEGKN